MDEKDRGDESVDNEKEVLRECLQMIGRMLCQQNPIGEQDEGGL